MSDLDLLMNLDPLELTKDSPELEAIIAIYRKQRADAAAGIKPKKEKGPSIDISSVMDRLTGKAEPPKVTKTGSGMRRI